MVLFTEGHIKGAQQAMEKVDKTLVDNPLIFPTADFLSNAFAFMALEEKTRTKYETEFTKVIGG